MKALNGLALLLVAVGALNWGLVGIFEWDLVAELFGETFGVTNDAIRVVYIVVGAAGVYVAAVLLPAALLGTGRSSRPAHVDRRADPPGVV